jgi:hypothetical protein
MTDKEIKILIDKAFTNLKNKFSPKDNLFLDRINRKVMRFKKLNETEEKKLKEIAS